MSLGDLLSFVKQEFQVCESPTTSQRGKTGIVVTRPMSLCASSCVTLKWKSPSFLAGTCLAEEYCFHCRSADFYFYAFSLLPLCATSPIDKLKAFPQPR